MKNEKVRLQKVDAPFALLASAKRQPPALPGSIKKLYNAKDLLVE